MLIDFIPCITVPEDVKMSVKLPLVLNQANPTDTELTKTYMLILFFSQ